MNHGPGPVEPPPDDSCVYGTPCAPAYCNTPSTCPPAIGTFGARLTKSADTSGTVYVYTLIYDPENGRFPAGEFIPWLGSTDVTYDAYCFTSTTGSCGTSASYPVVRLDHWQLQLHDGQHHWWAEPMFENWHTGWNNSGQTMVRPTPGAKGARCISSSTVSSFCRASLYETEAWYDTEATSPCVSLDGFVRAPVVSTPGWLGGGGQSHHMPMSPIIDNGVCR